jgi:hypothetical protein
MTCVAGKIHHGIMGEVCYKMASIQMEDKIL